MGRLTRREAERAVETVLGVFQRRMKYSFDPVSSPSHRALLDEMASALCGEKPCDLHTPAGRGDEHVHCPVCGLAIWPEESHECPPGFGLAGMVTLVLTHEHCGGRVNVDSGKCRRCRRKPKEGQMLFVDEADV